MKERKLSDKYSDIKKANEVLLEKKGINSLLDADVKIQILENDIEGVTKIMKDLNNLLNKANKVLSLTSYIIARLKAEHKYHLITQDIEKSSIVDNPEKIILEVIRSASELSGPVLERIHMALLNSYELFDQEDLHKPIQDTIKRNDQKG